MINRVIVSMHAVSFGYPRNFPFVRTDHGSGFGALSEAEALAEAERRLPFELARFSAGCCIELSEVCATCKVTGKKPGCKRKKCPTCRGRGTIGHHSFVVLKPEVNVDTNPDDLVTRLIRESMGMEPA